MYNPAQTNEMPKSAKIKNLIWSLFNSTIFRITPPNLQYSENQEFIF